MDFKDIDAMFEDATRRIKSGATPGGAYGDPPMAADHFLVKRSWEFFQKRLKAIEDHWGQIAAAKDAEIEALLKAEKENRKILHELQSQTTETQEVDRTLISGRLEDQQEFAARIRELQAMWVAEREALERAVTDADNLKNRMRKECEVRLAAMDRELKEVRASLENARVEIASLTEKRAAGEGDAAETLLKRDDVIRSLESKVELLKSELARREQVSREQSERHRDLAKEHERLLSETRGVRASLAAAQDRSRELEERVASARRELEEIRAARQREQAEWRELWERAREMRDIEKRNARGGDFPTENR